MAQPQGTQYQITTPERFPFATPAEWTRWSRRFERFRVASGLNNKPEEEQVNSLIYMMGDQADDILVSFNLTTEQAKQYETVMRRFKEHFIIRNNVIFERATFNTRSQREGEPVEEFITSLYNLAETCEYGALKEEMIRDRIVVGIRDHKLSERLQLEPTLTLTKAVTMVRSAEEVKKQSKTLHTEKNPVKSQDVDQIKSNQRGKDQKWKKTKPQPNQVENTSKTAKKCMRCGKDHKRDQQSCPAINSICHKCQKAGHWAKVCRGAMVKRVDGEENNAAFLGEVTDDNEKQWRVPIQVNNQTITFKIDTGADVTVLPAKQYTHLFQRNECNPPDKTLYGAARTKLQVTTMARATLSHKDKKAYENIYLVERTIEPLLSRKASVALNLIARIHTVETNTPTNKKLNPHQEFPELFKGIGRMPAEYEIKLKPGARPLAVTAPRRVPIPLMKQVKANLDKMVQQGVITPVEEPTEWCAPMVVAPKPNGKVRLCLDFTQLNQWVKREYHPLPAVNHILGQLSGAKIMSKLDATWGYWQVPLAEKSKHLTTFITPFGRFRCNRLPFGITSAAEHYQRKMSKILEGIDGIVCLQDDILVWGTTQPEHDKKVRQVLTRLKDNGVTLNPEKCQFSLSEVKFLGHHLDKNGIRLDPDKVKAITEMTPPTTTTELKRFLGMVNYLTRFMPHMATVLHPLHVLLSSKTDWTWGDHQRKAFNQIKEMLSSSPVMALFDPDRKTTVSADASSYGLGAVLRQTQPDGTERAVAYASKSLSPAETRYAQIEKEALATAWACQKFEDYIIGIHITIETDHKPLVPILMTKTLDDLTPRIQRIKMRMMRYDYEITYVPGKDLTVADALSRQPLPECSTKELEEEMTAHVQCVIKGLPATDIRLQQIREQQAQDETCVHLTKYAQSEWPDKKQIHQSCAEYWPHRWDISYQDGLLMRGNRLIIPTVMRKEMLRRVHDGHQGITKCRSRAREAIWWPGLSTEIEELIRKCPECIKESSNRQQPLMPAEFPQRPWQKLGMDIFHMQNQNFIVISDYYSRYFEIARLENMRSQTVIEHIKAIFARHGIPEVLYSDNGPQFQSVLTSEFFKFATEYGFEHKTSSPTFPQSNGFAEAAVKIAKARLSKDNDPYRALLAYRSTPLSNGFSPAELLMGRRLRTTLPIATRSLNPELPDQNSLRQKESNRIRKQKHDFDRRHGVRTLKPVQPGDRVWITNKRANGVVQSEANTPRSYWIKTQSGVVRRNRQHLIHNTGSQSPEEEEQTEQDTPAGQSQQTDADAHGEPPSDTPTTETPPKMSRTGSYQTRSGRFVKKPDRMNL